EQLILKDIANSARLGGQVDARRTIEQNAVAEADAARGGLAQAGQHRQQARLAAPRGTKDRRDALLGVKSQLAGEARRDTQQKSKLKQTHGDPPGAPGIRGRQKRRRPAHLSPRSTATFAARKPPGAYRSGRRSAARWSAAARSCRRTSASPRT